MEIYLKKKMAELKSTHPVKLFFAGTDTNVGKTFAAALVAKMYRHSGVSVGVYKPAESGCSRVEGVLTADDALTLWRAAGQPRTLSDVCPQKFQAPLAPGQAARAEAKSVDPERLRTGLNCWDNGFDVVIIEGAGGLFSPLADGFLNIDLVKQIQYRSPVGRYGKPARSDPPNTGNLRRRSASRSDH